MAILDGAHELLISAFLLDETAEYSDIHGCWPGMA
jgi:hypothetical protein